MQRHQANRHRRHHRPSQPIMLQPGQVAFRVVCHVSIIGGLIGHSGSVISQIRRQTGCTVCCEELAPGAEHRVIVVVGPVTPGRKIAITSTEAGEEEEKELVSVAQEAVIRVCERMWEVDAWNRGVSKSGLTSEGYCGLLADRTQIGPVVGRGGRNVLRMRRESGARIMMLPAPLCAANGDELIQITGDILAVKRALVAVTECLHDCPPHSKDHFLFARPVETTSHMPSSDPHAEFFPHLSPLLPPLTGNTPCSNALSSDADVGHDQDMKSMQREVSFRLLCSHGAAGSIIGQRGSIVRTLQNETGASIMFAAPVTLSGERIVTISAFENLESWYSPAQNAIVLVFARSIEHDIEKRVLLGLIKGATVTARLLVASDVVCCLNANNDGVDSEIAEASGANIQILEGEQNSDFSLENDVVVEITGEYIHVQKALSIVTGKLRDSLLPSEVLNEVRARDSRGVMDIASTRMQQPSLLSLGSDQEISLTRGMDQLRLSSSLDGTSAPGMQSLEKFGRAEITVSKNRENRLTPYSKSSEFPRPLQVLLPKEAHNEEGTRRPSRRARDSTFCGSHSSLGLASDPYQKFTLTRRNNKPKLSDIGHPSPALFMQQTAGRGSTTLEARMESESLRRRKELPVIANTTVEFVIPEDMLGSVYGEDGSNVARLGQISGAKVEMRNPSPSKSEKMLIISGTPDQTRAAQSLLQAFILADH